LLIVGSDFAEEVAAWFIVGLLLFTAGIIVFVYSEVKVSLSLQ
jgi:hypothetical protein